MLKIAICDDSREDIEQLKAALGALCGYQIDYDVYFSVEELLKYTAQRKLSYVYFRHRNAGHDRAGTGKGITAKGFKSIVCISDRLFPVCHGCI